MRLTTSLLILLAGVVISVAVWAISGGRVVLLLLPLLFALPLVWRRG